MKIVNKLMLLLSFGVLALSACNGVNPASSSAGGDSSGEEESSSSYNPEDDGPYTGVNPYVKKVANMPDDFIVGMDSSSVLSLEESGVKYYDFDKTEAEDLFVILARHGVNTIRIRIWNDPFVDIANVKDYSTKEYEKNADGDTVYCHKGTFVSNDGVLYRTKEDIVTKVAFNASKFTEVAKYYSNTATYAVGALVVYNNLVYRCKTAVTSGEAFNEEKWDLAFCEGRIGYGGGNVDIDRAVTIGKRVTAAGMKVLANFHYSDTWADPGRQIAPKAWKGQTFEQKLDSIYNYTKESMQKFKDNNVDVAYVQIGNETNNAFVGETHARNYSNFAQMVSQGTKAVKEVYADAQTIVHFTNPESLSYRTIAQYLDAAECNYDIFGTSYYPYYHGTLDNLVLQLNRAATASGKKVMVCETSYANTNLDSDNGGNQFNKDSGNDMYYPITQGGQIANFRNVCDALVNRVNNNAGLGVCYWEGTWIGVGTEWASNKEKWEEYGSGWASDWAAEYDTEVEKSRGGGTQVDNQCFFDKDGKALDSLKMFGLLKTGNRTEEWVEGAEEASVDFMTNEDITLPATVKAIYNSDNRRETAVTWDLSKATIGKETINMNGDWNVIKQNGPGIYTFKGTIKDGTKTFEASCKLNLEVANYVTDPSFEENVNPVTKGGAANVVSNDAWAITDNDETTNKGYLYITNGNKNNPIKPGNWNVHGYTDEGHMNYELMQTLDSSKIKKDVSVKLRFFVSGGATAKPVPEANQNMYAYILENDSEVKRVSFKLVSYEDGVAQVDLEGISLKVGKTYKLGFHIEVNSPGVWIDIDNVSLYE